MSTEMSTGQRTWASGPVVFAGAIMVIGGVWQLFTGTAALVHSAIVESAPQYVYTFELTSWGWIQMLTGILSVAAGFAALRGQTWARIVGIVLASLSMVMQFMFIPHYPLWSSLIIAVDIVIIWGLCTYAATTGSRAEQTDRDG